MFMVTPVVGIRFPWNHGIRLGQKNQAGIAPGPIFMGRGVHPTALPSCFHIVGAVKRRCFHRHGAAMLTVSSKMLT
jgi:hypothetical protein